MFVKAIVAFFIYSCSGVLAKSSKRKANDEIQTMRGTCINPAESSDVYWKERVAYGDKISVGLTAYAQDEIEDKYISSPMEVQHEFIVGKHNVPAVNDGVIGMCVGEVRKMLARIGKSSGPALAYLVNLKEINGKAYLKQISGIEGELHDEL